MFRLVEELIDQCVQGLVLTAFCSSVNYKMMRSVFAHTGLRTIRPQFMNRMLLQTRNNSNLTESLKSTRAFPEDLTKIPTDAIEIPNVAESLEFGANTPVGWIENALDLLHTTGDFSW